MHKYKTPNCHVIVCCASCILSLAFHMSGCVASISGFSCCVFVWLACIDADAAVLRSAYPEFQLSLRTQRILRTIINGIRIISLLSTTRQWNTHFINAGSGKRLYINVHFVFILLFFVVNMLMVIYVNVNLLIKKK